MLNLDFSKELLIDTQAMNWLPSPLAGVMRKPLEREGKEHGYTTSIVKYEPGSRFSEHRHPMGEEILVLSGVFSDEHGDYPAGSYLRNPPNSRHSPFSHEGCEIFVKLNQFSIEDTTTINRAVEINAIEPGWTLLHNHSDETVWLVSLTIGDEVILPMESQGIEELLLFDGEISVDGNAYPNGLWFRSTLLAEHKLVAGSDAKLIVRTRPIPRFASVVSS
ncbi:cupin domain-containing protein [Vibrio maerlii]|uniref:cupin domain-containing protein n=1 Tax=Vibrio maerlii TaxID=2231648 RepID=UPI000E3EB218|nr:cupin domain-containing protein [Vibrio maerlii]